MEIMLFSDWLKVMRDADNETLREIFNGAWFALGLAMMVAFTMLVVQRIRNRHLLHHSIYQDMVLQLSIALLLYSTASSMRSGFIWALLHCQNLYGEAVCEHISSYVQIVSVAALLSIISAVLIIKLLSPSKWRPWLAISVTAFAVGAPTAFYMSTHFLQFGPTNGPQFDASYNPWLVMASVAVAMIGNYVALELIIHSRKIGNRPATWFWTVMAGVVMGLSIWSMHFIGILSLNLEGALITFDVPGTLLSVGIPTVRSGEH